MTNQEDQTLSELTSDIVSAYVRNNAVSTDMLPNLITEVHRALKKAPIAAMQLSADAQEPAVPTKQSVRKNYIVCLEEGDRFKSMKRHLRSEHNMTPGEYREKWGLPPNYPMVAPSYADRRSELAKAMGLGQRTGGKTKKGR
jgi:predicted transcriptional regulator